MRGAGKEGAALSGGGRRSGGMRRLRAPLAAVAAALLAAVALATPVPVAAAGRPQAPPARQDEVRVTGGPVEIRADPGLERVARALARDRRAYAPLPGIGDPLSVLPGAPEVWVVADLSRVPGPGPGRQAERWAAGFADASRNLVAVRAGEAGPGELAALRRTFRHELAHLALSAATGGRAPRWLHEGYAQIVSGEFGWQEAWRLRIALTGDDAGLLRQLRLDFPGREDEARTAYLLSYTAVHELLRRGGERALASFFRRLREGRTVDGALRDVYHVTLAQFEQQWRESVKSRYGWLFLLSRASLFWVLLTVGLLLLGWRRWKHQREKWEELRRRDAEVPDEPAWWETEDGTPERW